MIKMMHFGTAAILCCFMMVLPAYAQTDQSKPSEGEPQAPLAADVDTYIVGPEDVLHIHVWKEDALSKTVTVRMDGKITLPLLDDIHVAGKTPLRLKEILTEKFKEFIDSPTISVVVIETNSYKVFISGQVKSPGVIRLRSETTLAQVISMAGGLLDWANEKTIMVVRKEDGQQKILTVNYKPSRPGAGSQLDQLKKHLSELEARYTQKHPDIIATKRKIAELEEKSKAASRKEEGDKQDFGISLVLKPGDTIIVP